MVVAIFFLEVVVYVEYVANIENDRFHTRLSIEIVTIQKWRHCFGKAGHHLFCNLFFVSYRTTIITVQFNPSSFFHFKTEYWELV